MRASALRLFISLVVALFFGCTGCSGGGGSSDGTPSSNPGGLPDENGSVVGHSTAAKTGAEPPGTNCAHGGIKVETGIDTNGNGVLDDNEVQNVQYVCNGADGIDGTGGGDSEITEDSFCFNDVTIKNAADVAAFSTVIMLIGNLTVDAAYNSALLLPKLRYVSGDFNIDGNPSSLHLSSLSRVGSALVIRTQDSALTVPALTDVGSNLTVRNTSLVTVELPQLTNAPYIYIMDNASLSTISIPLLSQLNDLRIQNNHSLTVLNLNTLRWPYRLTISDNPSITSISLPALWESWYPTSVGGITVSNNVALETMSMANLVRVDDLTISNNYSLTTLSAKSLKVVSRNLKITGNRTAGVSGLTDATADALRAQLTTLGGTYTKVPTNNP